MTKETEKANKARTRISPKSGKLKVLRNPLQKKVVDFESLS